MSYLELLVMFEQLIKCDLWAGLGIFVKSSSIDSAFDPILHFSNFSLMSFI